VTVFQTPLNLYDLPLFLLAFILTLVSLACLGLVFSSAFVLSRAAGVLTNGLEFPIYVGTGTMFPIALLPLWTHPLAFILGPTWGIDAIRYAAASDYSWGLQPGYWGDLAIMGVLSVCYLAIAVWLFKQVDHRARRDANLGRY
jgi:ABC-2 type transport system permease protein